jgi:hypothetical protein
MNFKRWKWSCKNCQSKELRIIGRYDLSIGIYFQLFSEKQNFIHFKSQGAQYFGLLYVQIETSHPFGTSLKTRRILPSNIPEYVSIHSHCKTVKHRKYRHILQIEINKEGIQVKQSFSSLNGRSVKKRQKCYEISTGRPVA